MQSVRLCTALLLTTVVLVNPCLAQVSEPEPFFSEYVEGADGKDGSRGDLDDVIELFNPTGVPFDLGSAGCVIEIYFDGSAVPIPFDLTGIVIPAGGTVIITSEGASLDLQAIATAVFAGFNFDGNDALALLCASLPQRGGRATFLDVIGVPGFDPGAGGWTGLGLSTVDFVLQRNPYQTMGGTTFDLSGWGGSSSAGYDYGDLGNYLPVELLTFSVE